MSISCDANESACDIGIPSPTLTKAESIHSWIQDLPSPTRLVTTNRKRSNIHTEPSRIRQRLYLQELSNKMPPQKPRRKPKEQARKPGESSQKPGTAWRAGDDRATLDENNQGGEDLQAISETPTPKPKVKPKQSARNSAQSPMKPAAARKARGDFAVHDEQEEEGEEESPQLFPMLSLTNRPALQPPSDEIARSRSDTTIRTSEPHSNRSQSPTKMAEMQNLPKGINTEVLVDLEEIGDQHPLSSVLPLLEDLQRFSRGIGVLDSTAQVSTCVRPMEAPTNYAYSQTLLK